MEAVMDKLLSDEVVAQVKALVSLVPVKAIRTEDDYDKAVQLLNQLLDAGAADENSVLADLANSLGSLIGDYDDRHYRAEQLSPAATLRFLMQQHHLKQSDLPEVGTQGVISEILREKRALNVRQIKLLAARFDVPAGVFV